MRNYAPDYVSIKEYQRLLNENRARQVLVQAATQSWLAPLDRPTTTFLKLNEADFANRLSRAQQAAAVLEPKINQLYQILIEGQKDRPRLTTPRWQAGYDLSLGRVLAMKVRTEGYNIVLAQAKGGMQFKNPKNNTWRLVRSNKITTGSVHEKQAKEAKELLGRVMREHKGTPWGLLALEELAKPMGWRWEEDFSETPEQRRQRERAMPKKNTPKKELRPPPKL